MGILTYIAAMLVLIGILVTIHELGHYWAAIICGVKVEAFSFGFGPRLFGFRRGDTDFKICAIPLGGYVKMAGEMYGDGLTAAPEEPTDPRSFLAKPRYQRLFIAFAGPAMNVVLAIVILTGINLFHFPTIEMPDGPLTISVVQKGGPADQAGLREGDQIVEINGQRDVRWLDFLKEVAISVNNPVSLVYLRDGRENRTTVTPVEDPQSRLGDVGLEGDTDVEVARLTPGMPADQAGVKVGDILVSANGHPLRSQVALLRRVRENPGQPVDLIVKRNNQLITFRMMPKLDQEQGETAPQWRIGLVPRLRQTFVSLPFPQALQQAVRQSADSAGLIYRLLQGMIVRRISAKTVSGPLGLAVAAGETARAGILPFIQLMADVSINLAVINLLPIPILDGGMILMLLIEMAARRDLSLRIKESVLKVGLAFLLMVVALVLYNDISKLLG